MGTILVGGILLIIVGLIINNMVQEKKKGKSVQCGCSCEGCMKGCRR